MKASELPFTTNLKDKVAVITGAGGVLCSLMAKAMAACGAKVAVLDLHLSSAQKVADEITAEGYVAKAYEANCLDKASLLACHEAVLKDFGKCDILINGAGGNSPKASTTQEFYAPKVSEDTITFFDLKEEGFNFVFNLNILATLVTTQIFAADMIGREGCSVLNISSMNAFTPLTKIPAYSSAKAGVSNFTKWLATYFAKEGRIYFAHLRNVLYTDDKDSFVEVGHYSGSGSLDMFQIVKNLVDNGFDGYVRPDHGRNIFGENEKPGYGLYDRALGCAYINGLFEACEKSKK